MSDTHPSSHKIIIMNRILLAIGAMLTLFLAALHIIFPWFFQWETSLSSLSNSNRAVFLTAHLWIILILITFACVSFLTWRDLLSTVLGRILLLSIGLLWSIRAYTEVTCFRIGVDGSGWRVFLFGAIAVIYWIPLLSAWYNTLQAAIPGFSTNPR